MNISIEEILKAPIGILILLIFSGVVSSFAIYYYVAASESFRSALVPHVGWIGLLLYILFFLSSILLLITRKDDIRKNIVIGLYLLLCYGIFNCYLHYGAEDYGNPYLVYGAFRPLWEIFLPLLWIVVLSAKSVKSYCR